MIMVLGVCSSTSSPGEGAGGESRAVRIRGTPGEAEGRRSKASPKRGQRVAMALSAVNSTAAQDQVPCS